MKQTLKKVLSIVALLTLSSIRAQECCPQKPLNCCTTTKSNCDPVSCYRIRSQSRDKTRQLVGMVDFTHLFGCDEPCGVFSIMPVYMQTFRPRDIAGCLFGQDALDTCCNRGGSSTPGKSTIFIQGSSFQGDDRNPNAWLADYFYLPIDYNGEISFEPTIKNFLIDLDFYKSIGDCGLYFRIYGPITYTKWDLNFSECSLRTTESPYPAGYFNSIPFGGSELNFAVGIPHQNLFKCFSQYARGESITVPLDDTIYQPLKYAKFDKCARSDIGFADLRAELGWDVWECCNKSAFSVNFQMAFPTGTKCKPCYLFSPIIGNGHHWELGGGLWGYYNFCDFDDPNKEFSFYVDLNLTHLFGTNQARTFDLCDKPNSKYMLAEKFEKNIFEMGSSNNGMETGTLIPASKQFAKEFAPVANLTTVEVDVSVGVQVDLVGMFHYACDCFNWDFGYNFFAQSCESIKCPDTCGKCNTKEPNLCDFKNEETWALKGDARVFGYLASSNDAIPLSATQRDSDIHNGTNRVPLNFGSEDINPNVDCPQPAVRDNGTLLTPLLNRFNGTEYQINTSIQPKFLSCEDINFLSQRLQSHKIFTHFSYTFDECSCLPTLGVGGFVEFGKTDSCRTCDESCKECKDCVDCTPSQWGVWLKATFAYN